jgi:REP element-mobilizing transposase RayT
MAAQLSFALPKPKRKPTHGGRRLGAGRPPRGPRSSERHKKRATIKRTWPVHVVARALPSVGRLRTKANFAAIRESLTGMMISDDAQEDTALRFRVIHVSIQGSHLHFIVEAHDQYALARGMQSLLRSIARRINRHRGTTGSSVFGDRYFAVALRSPRQVRNTLAYVLNNWRHHNEDRRRPSNVDPYSTGWQFDGWQQRVDDAFAFELPTGYEPLPVWLPRTWLLRVGWKAHDRRIDFHEVPGGAE